jgi:hypothetical protein
MRFQKDATRPILVAFFPSQTAFSCFWEVPENVSSLPRSHSRSSLVRSQRPAPGTPCSSILLSTHLSSVMSPNATPASAPPASRGRDQNKDSRVSSRTTKDTRLSSTTRLCFRALILAAGTVATNAQGGISAQGGMYYPYGSTFGPMYGYALAVACSHTRSRRVVSSQKKS